MNKLLWQVIETMPKDAPGLKEHTVDALNVALSKVKYQYKKAGKSYDESKIKVLNVGAGKGLENIWILENSKVSLTAIDAHEPYLNILEEKAEKLMLTDRLKCQFEDMADLPFRRNTFDIIWCEGSIHYVGFDKGIKEFKKLLKPGGIIVIADYILKDLNMPLELKRYFEGFYPEIDTIDSNINLCEQNGLKVAATFIATEDAWWRNYLAPLRIKCNELNLEYQMDLDKRKMIKEIQVDLEMREKYKDYYDFAYYILQKK